MMNHRGHRNVSTFAQRTLAALGAAFLVAAFAPAALAATSAEQAEALIKEGVRLRSVDRASAALPLFERAYTLAPSGRTAAQLGLCQLELGRFAEAEHNLTQALAGPSNPWVTKNRSVLEKQLESARANIGELELSVSPATAEVSLNGKPVERARLSAPLRLDKGEVTIEVRADGYEPAHDTVTIVGGRREQRTFALTATRPAAPAAPVAVAAPPPPSSSAAPGADLAAPETHGADGAPSRHASASRIAAWITAGVAVGALGFGTVEAFNAASKRDAFNNHTGVVSGVVVQDCGTANLSAACKPLKDAYDQALTLSIVGFATAGALAIASSTLFVLSSGSSEPRENVAGFACSPDLSRRGFSCVLRF